MALTKIGTDGVKDDAVTSDKVANAINSAIAANTAKTSLEDESVTLAKLEHGTGSNDGKFLRANNGADPSFETITGTTINNNADNRVITGSGTANTLEGEASLTFSAGLLKIDDHAGNAGNGRLEFGNSGEQFIEGYDTGNAGSSSFLKFGDGSTERMRIQNGGGISFNGDTAAANALDDYEEGTFTPTCQSGGFSNWITNSGRYTKIGRLVHVHWENNFNGTGDGTTLQIGGLPFVATDWAAGSMYAQGYTLEGSHMATPAVADGQAYIKVILWGSEATGNQFSGYSAWNITYTTSS